ncbi:uncharacterized protein [Chelonus insularis]|uniref:uncharacterized protein n=1 Tax=Chelonus insularis TaxID=460826 RepID=UPI00158CA106|nr:uncharacterized protein LOC118069896 [Chelonus insularis]
MSADLRKPWDKDKKLTVFLVNTVPLVNQHSFLPLPRINLIIFDECHHGVKDHPMRQIMKSFEVFDEAQHPKILGLTATLINSNINAIKLQCHKLLLKLNLDLYQHQKIKIRGKTLHFSDDEIPSDEEATNENIDDTDEYGTHIEDILDDTDDHDTVKEDTKIEADINILSLNKNVYRWTSMKEPSDLERNISKNF